MRWGTCLSPVSALWAADARDLEHAGIRRDGVPVRRLDVRGMIRDLTGVGGWTGAPALAFDAIADEFGRRFGIETPG